MSVEQVTTEEAPALNEDKASSSRHGVFYPTGFVVAAFASARVARQVYDTILQTVDSEEVRLREPAEMQGLMEESVENAGVMAKVVSAELKQVEMLRQFADAGHWFVIFDRSELGEIGLQSIVAAANPSRMIHYGMLAIENLTPEDHSLPGDSPLGINERGRS